jgi:hypothetical protein
MSTFFFETQSPLNGGSSQCGKQDFAETNVTQQR